MWPWSGHLYPQWRLHSDGWGNGGQQRKWKTNSIKRKFKPLLFILFVKRREVISAAIVCWLLLPQGAFWFKHWSSLKTIEVKSFHRCNMCPVYAVNPHNQIQTLFFHQITHHPSPFLSKGQNPSERPRRCVATCEGAVHPFHFLQLLQDSELTNSLCYWFHCIYFAGF